MTSAAPALSIVVPVLNGEDTIGACIESLLKAEYPEDRREILVVDNGSTDETAARVGAYPVTFLQEAAPGCAAARNRGIRESRGEIVVSTDADCLATRAWLRELVQPFEDPRVGAVAGEVAAFPPRTPAEWYAARGRHMSPQKYLARPRLPFAPFANLAFRRDVFDVIGLLDESIPWGESTDFCTRFLRGTGLQLAYARRALVFHRHRASTRGFIQQWKYGRGHAQLDITYGDEIPWRWRQSVLAYAEIARAGAAFARHGLRHAIRGDRRTEARFCYFELLKKLAERVGFVQESLSRGRLYL